jgi:hypothetical protein
LLRARSRRRALIGGEEARHLGAHAGPIGHVAVGQREEIIVIGLVGKPAEEELAELAPSVTREVHGEEGHVQRWIGDPEAVEELDAVDGERPSGMK